MAKKYTTRKYDGDDCYSWAVFRTADVKGLCGVVFYGQARPLGCGMSRNSAQHEAKRLNEKE